MSKKMSELEKEYGVDFGLPSDPTMIQYLKDEGYPSLAEALEMIAPDK